MISDNFPQNPVLPLITSFSPKERALFVLAMAYHQSPNFMLWCLIDEKRVDNLEIFEKCLNYLETMLQGGGSEKGIRSRRQEISKLMDECYADDCIGGALAGDCITALDTAYECALDEDDNGPADVSMMSLAGAMSRYDEELDSKQPNDDEASEIFATEIDFQKQIAYFIKKANVQSSRKVKSQLINELLAIVEDHGISNVGLDFNLLEDEKVQETDCNNIPF